MSKDKYIIITPAKNEAKFVRYTLESVINQTIKPLKWIIVDDGSTDSTPDIINDYVSKYSFIKLVQRDKTDSRNFGSKVHAIREGFKELPDLEYDYYCNLDADVSFEPDYFEKLLNKFETNSKLGICGGKVYDLVNDHFVRQQSGEDSVAGPIQFFRKECYEEINGYTYSKVGLVDAIAEITARMRGWETKTFPELIVKHHRKTSSANNNKYSTALREGKTDFYLGYHPVWHIIRSIARIHTSPFIIGSILRTYSFILCYLTKEERNISLEFISFIRKEEFKKIKNTLNTLFANSR